MRKLMQSGGDRRLQAVDQLLLNTDQRTHVLICARAGGERHRCSSEVGIYVLDIRIPWLLLIAARSSREGEAVGTLSDWQQHAR